MGAVPILPGIRDKFSIPPKPLLIGLTNADTLIYDFLDIDISAQITQSIDAIDSVEEQEVSGDEGSAHSSETSVASLPTKKGIRFLPALAVAATVIMAVSLAFLPLDRNVDSGAERLVASISEHVPVVNRTLSEKHARTLNQYLLRHAENSVAGGRSGLMPLTRVANFSIAQN